MPFGSVIYDQSLNSTADSSWSYESYKKIKDASIDLSDLFKNIKIQKSKQNTPTEDSVIHSNKLSYENIID
uniref:Uncharacterized protein n=1 Tax=viral metagenome TaxID=1070528 RepID=A0A6C0F893_9ZZZZ